MRDETREGEEKRGRIGRQGMNVGRKEPEREGALGCLRERERGKKSSQSPSSL